MVNVYSCLSYINVYILQFCFLREIEQDAFTRSMATFYVLETLLIYSSKDIILSAVASVGFLIWLNLRWFAIILLDLFGFYRVQVGKLNEYILKTTMTMLFKSY